MQKPTKIAALALALTLILTPPASAAISVQLNGHPLTFDVPPVVESGRTLVPMRAIFEALGARITWDPASQTVSAVHPERDRYVILTLGSTTAWVDGQEVTLDVPPSLVDGRTMVPLRFVSTAMGAAVSYDPATETVAISQEPLTPPAQEAAKTDTTTESEPSGQSDTTAETGPATAKALSRYTRSVAYTHLEQTWYCVQGMQPRFDGFTSAFAEHDDEWLVTERSYLEDTAACWSDYEAGLLSTLAAPIGAEAAHQALQLWVDLNQDALEQLTLADKAHQQGATAERDHLVQEGLQILNAAAEQETKMLSAMNAITSNDPEFLTVAEHQYVAWLDDMVGLTDNCLSTLHMIQYMDELESDMTAAEWAEAASACMNDLPADLSTETPPTVRMQQLQQAVLDDLPALTDQVATLAAKLEAGPMEPEAIAQEIGVIGEAFATAREGWNELFVYRDWGKE